MNIKVKSFVKGFVLAIGLSATVASAATSVSGNVSGTWTQTGSPYLVTGDILILQGNRLTIQSNVIVQFQGPYVLEADGTLQASGTSNNPVVFTSENSGVSWSGIFFNGSDPSSFLTYCQVSGSTNSGIRIQNTAPAIRNCVIAGNSSPGFGGGVNALLSSGNLFISRCIITNNTANAGGGLCVADNVDVGNCSFSGNQAYVGGAVYLSLNGGTATFKNCDLSGNNASYVSGGIYGAYNGGSAYLYNCTIAANNAINAAAGFYSEGGGMSTFVNCTVVSNNISGLYIGGNHTSANIMNSVIYHNAAGGQQVVLDGNGQLIINYSDVQGGIPPGTGNISFNPNLNTNLLLLPSSACIDAGNPDPAFNDVSFPPSQGGVRNDMGAFGGPGASGWLAGDAPSIVSQPQSLTSCLGQTTTFTVLATGSSPLNYQWYFNGGILIEGTNSSLTLTGLQKSQEGSYYVVVSNVFGSVTSTTNQQVVNDACVDICMYAGLTIAGQQGSTYVLKYTPDLNNTNFATWTPLATNTMGSSNWFYLDMGSCGAPRRFYGVKLAP